MTRRRPSDESRQCDACGKTYSHQKGRPSKFCSIACKATTQRTLPDAAPKPCPTCGRDFTPPRKVARQAKFCSHSCAMQANTAVRAAAVRPEVIAKRSDKRRGTGKPGNYIKRGGRHEHRVVAEESLGRKLQPGEIVHHDDEVRSNNHPDNLKVMTKAEHSRLHTTERRRREKEKANG